MVAAAAPAVLDLPPVDPSMASFGDEDPLMGIPRFNPAAAVEAPPAALPPALPALEIEEFPVEIEMSESEPLALAPAENEETEDQEGGGNVGKPKLTWNWQPTDSIKIIKL
jgi:hypothetical protein